MIGEMSFSKILHRINQFTSDDEKLDISMRENQPAAGPEASTKTALSSTDSHNIIIDYYIENVKDLFG